MRIQLASVMVDDQDKALEFYTEVLGFVKNTEIPMGEFKWLTVVSPEGPEHIELVLEPMGFPQPRRIRRHCSRLGSPQPPSHRTISRLSTVDSRSGASRFVASPRAPGP